MKPAPFRSSLTGDASWLPEVELVDRASEPVERNAAGMPTALGTDELLLAVAGEIFVERGFRGASMTQIADRAGYSKGVLYYYFGSKTQLFELVVLRQCAHHRRQLAVPSSLDVRSYLTVVLYRLTRLMFSDRSLATHRMMAFDSASFPELSRALLESGIRRAEQQIARCLTPTIFDGRMESCAPTMAAQQLVSLALGAPYQKCLQCSSPPPSADEIDARILSAIDTILGAYGPELDLVPAPVGARN